ncbi:MAG: phospholipase D-like domain-containing protein [Candidatus Xenobia bacterium]
MATTASLIDGQDAACHRGNTGGPVFRANELLQGVAQQGVPIIYLGDPKDAAALSQFPAGTLMDAQGLRDFARANPQAKLFELGHDAGGEDLKAFSSTNGAVYLLNDDARQSKVPAGFAGVLTDDYTPEFITRVLQDLKQGHAAPPAPNENPPASHGPTGLREKLGGWRRELIYVSGLVQHALTFVHGGQAERTVKSSSPQQLAAMTPLQLSRLADGLLKEHDGPQFMRVITAHGNDAGHIDGVLSMLTEHPQAKLRGTDLAQFQKLRQQMVARPGDWAGFESYLDGATGTQARPGSKVDAFINGENAYPVLLDAIDHAREHVNLSVFSFQSDQAGWDFARHMAAAADRGVTVRLIYDEVGSDHANGAPQDPAIFAYLRQHGVQVLEQKVAPLEVTHRKLMDVDGTAGFIGGMNVGDEYRNVWHDVHTRITGPAATDVHDLFAAQWVADGGAPLPAAERKTNAPVPGGAPARVIGHVGEQDQAIKLAYLRAIDTAQHTINILDPYFTDVEVAQHLEAAAGRGVHVNLVMPRVNDTGLTQFIERTMYHDLITAGVHVYEYSGRPMSHGKIASFDGCMATVGSSNLDARSTLYDDEANVWTSDRAVVSQLDQQLFAHDLTQSQEMTTGPVTLADRAKRVAAGVLRLIQ